MGGGVLVDNWVLWFECVPSSLCVGDLIFKFICMYVCMLVVLEVGPLGCSEG
jgi:hypothetical protein